MTLTEEVLTEYVALVLWSAFFGAAFYAAIEGAVALIGWGFERLRARRRAARRADA